MIPLYGIIMTKRLREPSAEFLKQYDYAKELAVSAMSEGKNVIIFGKGANGKTYLAKEVEMDALENNYQIYFGGRKYNNIFDDNSKAWIEIQNKDDAELTKAYLDKEIIDYVFIDMPLSLLQ